MNRLWGVAVFIFLAQGLQAQGTGPLYVVDGEFDGGQTSTLYRINPNDAAVLDVVGDTGENLLTIAVDPATGDVLGLTASNSANSDALVRIDPDTAVVSQVLPLVLPEGGEMPEFLDMFYNDVNESLLAVAYNPGHPPDHFLIGTQSGLLFSDLYIVGSSQISDSTLGVARRIETNSTSGNQTMFGCDSATGESRLIGYWNLGPNPTPPIAPPPTFLFPLTAETCVTAGTRADGHTFYGVGVPFAEGASRTLLRIDLAGDGSAEVETLGPLPDDAAGIAFGPIPQPSAIPALGGTGRALLVGLLLLAAGLMVRRSAGSARHREG